MVVRARMSQQGLGVYVPFKPTDLQTRGADGVGFSLRARKKAKQTKEG